MKKGDSPAEMKMEEPIEESQFHVENRTLYFQLFIFEHLILSDSI